MWTLFWVACHRPADTDTGADTAIDTSDTSDTSDTTDTSDTDIEDTGSPCDSLSLVEAVAFALPQPFGAIDDLYTDLDVGTTTIHYDASRDFTGDGRPDLAITDADASFGTVPGNTTWWVYPNEGTGFGSKIDWTLPPDQPAGTLKRLDGSGPSSCPDGQADHWYTWDVTGDSIADLVITEVCGDTTVGTSEWHIYPGDGAGFTTGGLNWTLPMYGTSAFTRIEQTNSTSGQPAYFVDDMDGDDVPDLVVAARSGDADLGATHWNVHLGSMGSYESIPLQWTLPVGPCAYVADERESLHDCDGDEVADLAFTVADLDADGTADLVAPLWTGDDTVGATKWKFFRGTPTGFSTAVDWALPPNGEPGDFPVVGMTPSSEIGSCYDYALVDMDGGGRPDLVLNNVCADYVVGIDVWRWYRSTGTGFVPDPVDIPLPEIYPDTSLDHARWSTYDCAASSEDFTHYVMDVDGDGRTDLLVTENCDDPAVATTQWTLHPNRCE